MKIIQKHQFKQVAAFAGLYFLAIGLGVPFGSLVDHRGNMFYAPAFSALVGGAIYRLYVEKIQRTGAILVVALRIGAFFLSLVMGPELFFLLLLEGWQIIAARGHLSVEARAMRSSSSFPLRQQGPFYDVVLSSQLPHVVTGSW